MKGHDRGSVFIYSSGITHETIGAGSHAAHEAGPGCAAGGNHAVGPIETCSARGELVDVGRFDVVDSEAIKLGPKVIDANQEYIRFLGRC